MALSSVALWQKSQDRYPTLHDMEDRCASLAETFDPVPNWVATWAIRRKIADMEVNEGEWMRYPAVLFCGLVKHRYP